MAQPRPLLCLCRSRNQGQQSIELLPEKPGRVRQKTMQKNRATQQPIDLGNAFWVQKRLKSSRCLLSLLIHSLFISASSAWAQLHCKIPVTDRQPPKSPNFSRQPHLLYFSRMGFTRKEVRQKLSKACSQRRLRHYTALHLRPFTCVSWKDTWSS